MVNEKEQKEFSKITNEEIKETYESMENTTSLNKPKPKKLTLKNDVIFQAFFSRKGNEKYLIDFLNALLKINIIKIDIREEVNLEKLSKSEKGGRLDLLATLNDDTIVNIEMQMENSGNILQRNEVYQSKIMSRESRAGVEYEDTKQIISVFILNYNLFGFEEYMQKTVTVLEEHRDYCIDKSIQTYYIQLPKFRKINPDMNNKLNQWLVFIDGEDWGKIKMAEKNNKILKEAEKEVNYLTGDAETRRLAELGEKWDFDWNWSMGYAKKEGREEGRKEGKKEGKKEMLKKQKETAKKLLKMGLSIEQISEATELSKVEINKLKEI